MTSNERTTDIREPVQSAQNPYEPRIEDIVNPPTRFIGRLRFLGPGMLTSAAVIGSGELIVTTSLGAEAGFAFLWLVIISALCKVWIQIEFAQYTILTGKTALDGYSEIGPRIGRLGIMNILWVINELPKLIQRGGIIGGAAAAFSLAVPILGKPLSAESMTFWVVVLAIGLMLVLYMNRYRMIERIATVSVLILVLISLVLALGLPFTPFGYDVSDIAGGLSFHIPAGTIGIAIAMFGLTGFTAPEINNYGYWCIEKGYSRWTGPDDGTEERAARAQGWLAVMRIDILTAWVVTTVCTLSFYVIGAAVLHPQGLVPSGNEVIRILSHMYTDTLGPWAGPLFLIAAILTLGSTLLAVGAGIPRLWANTLGILGVMNWKDSGSRLRVLRVLSLLLPALWAVSYFFVQEPVAMVMIGGISDGLLLVGMVVAAWAFRRRAVPKRFRQGIGWTPALVVSSVAIGLVGIVNILEIFGWLPEA